MKIKSYCVVLLLSLSCALLSGCASMQPTRLMYTSKITPTILSATDRELYFYEVIDQRKASQEMDMQFSKPVSQEVHTVLVDELTNNGLFNVIQERFSDQPRADDAYVLLVYIKDFSWEIPNYNSIKTKMLVTSFLTGGIGGVAYGGTKSTMNAHIEMSVVLKQNQEVLLDKTYESKASIVDKKLSIDTHLSKSKILGEALSEMLPEVISDLKEVLVLY